MIAGRDKKRHLSIRSLVIRSLLVVIMLLNVSAYVQARAMTHFVGGGSRTPVPEQLSVRSKLWTLVFGVQIPRPENRWTPTDSGLPYTQHHIAQPDGTILEAWFIPHPAARAIILMFPAYATSKASLLDAAVPLHEHGYATLLVDFRGTGGSSGDDTSLGIHEARDVAAVVAFVKATWPRQKIILYGVSLGAAAVLRAIAIEGVQPAAIIVESPFDRLHTTVGSRFQAMGLPSFPGAELLVFWGSVRLGSNGFVHNPVDYAKAVTCPVLMLHGDLDTRVTTAQATAIHNTFQGSKRMVPFPNAGHVQARQVDPARWIVEVDQFLREVIPQE